MQSVAVQALIDRFELDHAHGLTLEEWGHILWNIDTSYPSVPDPRPRHFVSPLHRLVVYALRAAQGFDVKHPDDIHPDEVDPFDDEDDCRAFTRADEIEGSPGTGPADTQLAA